MKISTPLASCLLVGDSACLYWGGDLNGLSSTHLARRCPRKTLTNKLIEIRKGSVRMTSRTKGHYHVSRCCVFVFKAPLNCWSGKTKKHEQTNNSDGMQVQNRLLQNT